ncbi:hypothetical protein BB561_000345 [Smittium simulii]|uniref:Carbonic anhydrase n=1 Tax=Smittium simulii TaxID=133385 RepID=A0A2T9YZD7_9FUNG|nr:hypothetical protein BB561_000345 [Smittium simulii]
MFATFLEMLYQLYSYFSTLLSKYYLGIPLYLFIVFVLFRKAQQPISFYYYNSHKSSTKMDPSLSPDIGSNFSRMLQANKLFAENRLRTSPDYFKKLSASQSPKVLWIGCSDSRASPEILTNSDLGEIFSLRNVANSVNDSDHNSKSIIQYAVNNLLVEEICVVGHTNCGGVLASMRFDDLTGDIRDWIHPIHKLYLENKDYIESFESIEDKSTELSKLNVKRVVATINDFDFVKSAKESGRTLFVNGFIFELETGLLNTL